MPNLARKFEGYFSSLSGIGFTGIITLHQTMGDSLAIIPSSVFSFLVSGWVKQTRSDSAECFTGTTRIENSARVSIG
jgi:hypothetical protein